MGHRGKRGRRHAGTRRAHAATTDVRPSCGRGFLQPPTVPLRRSSINCLPESGGVGWCALTPLMGGVRVLFNDWSHSQTLLVLVTCCLQHGRELSVFLFVFLVFRK